MLKPEQIDDLKKIAKSIKSMDHVYGSGLLTPLATKVTSRAAMTYQQIPQAKNLDNPEIPRVATGYEKVYGDRSTSYLKSDREYKVLKKVQKFGTNMVYALILKEVGTNYYHIVFRNEVESFAESSGVRMDNKIIDSKTEGDKIKEGEILFRSGSYDDEMNYRYGVNAKTLYLIEPAIVEDAIKISETMAKKLTSTSVTNLMIPKNNNDVLLNMYGDSKTYRVFPDIGEKTKNKIVCTRRRIDYNDALYLLKSKNLRKEMFGDVTYYAEGTVVDIDIYSNTPLDELPDDRSHEQLNGYLKHITNYWRELYDTLNDIVQDKSNEYSDDIGTTFARARDILSIGKRVKWNNDVSVFDNMIINITVAHSSRANIGSKLVGRHGNKGVISQIVPDEYMPKRVDDGEHVDIIYSSLGVIGRLNQSQLYEHEINWVVDSILGDENTTKKEKFDALLDLLSVVNTDQERVVKDFYKSLKKKEKEEFLDEMTTGFVVFQPPSKALSFKGYEKLIDRFDPKKKKFTVKHDDGTVSNIRRELIMSDSYVLRLKHEPITKFSARSKGTINPRTFLPIKSHAYSRGTALFNNQAIKLGHMEMDVLRLCGDQAAINYMTRLYCTSVVGRREFNKLLDTDVFSEDITIDMENSKSRVVDMFNSHLLTCGLMLDIEFADLDEVKPEVKEDIKTMRKKHIRVVFKDSYKKKKKKNK